MYGQHICMYQKLAQSSELSLKVRNANPLLLGRNYKCFLNSSGEGNTFSLDLN